MLVLFEIWGALLNGLSIYIIKKEDLLNTHFKELYRKNKISIMWLTAPLFSTLCEENANIFNGVKYLLTGGDNAFSKTY